MRNLKVCKKCKYLNNNKSKIKTKVLVGENNEAIVCMDDRVYRFLNKVAWVGKNKGEHFYQDNEVPSACPYKLEQLVMQ